MRGRHDGSFFGMFGSYTRAMCPCSGCYMVFFCCPLLSSGQAELQQGGRGQHLLILFYDNCLLTLFVINSDKYYGKRKKRT